MKSLSVTIQMKATEQYFPVVLFIMLYKVIQTFETVGEILKCDHSNESYWAVLSFGVVYYAVFVIQIFGSVGEILKCDHSNESYLNTFLSYCLFFFILTIVNSLYLEWDGQYPRNSPLKVSPFGHSFCPLFFVAMQKLLFKSSFMTEASMWKLSDL